MPCGSDFRRRNIENQQNLILSLILLCAYLLLCDGWCQVNDFGSLRKPHIVFSCDGLRILIPAKWKNVVVVLCFHFHYRAMIFSVLVALSLIYICMHRTTSHIIYTFGWRAEEKILKTHIAAEAEIHFDARWNALRRMSGWGKKRISDWCRLPSVLTYWMCAASRVLHVTLRAWIKFEYFKRITQ